jgi:hypothetical protein
MSEEAEEIDGIDGNIRNENQEEPTPIELGVLTGAILDYYETTGGEGFDEGEGWKENTEHDKRKSGVEIPGDLDEEIKKAFMTQIKKFQ